MRHHLMRLANRVLKCKIASHIIARIIIMAAMRCQEFFCGLKILNGADNGGLFTPPETRDTVEIPEFKKSVGFLQEMAGEISERLNGPSNFLAKTGASMAVAWKGRWPFLLLFRVAAGLSQNLLVGCNAKKVAWKRPSPYSITMRWPEGTCVNTCTNLRGRNIFGRIFRLDFPHPTQS
jgi:hypothetical protein